MADNTLDGQWVWCSEKRSRRVIVVLCRADHESGSVYHETHHPITRYGTPYKDRLIEYFYHHPNKKFKSLEELLAYRPRNRTKAKPYTLSDFLDGKDGATHTFVIVPDL